MTAQQTRISPLVRKRINQRAHELAQAAESRIRGQLEAQARAAAKAGTPPDQLLALLGEPLMTMNELYAASVTPEQAQAWADFVAGLSTMNDLVTWTPNKAT